MLCLAGILVFLVARPGTAQTDAHDLFVFEHPAFAGKGILFGRVIPAIEGRTRVTVADALGTVAGFPDVLSARHHGRILESRGLYAEGRYLEAARVLEPALADEPDNPFLKNEYARALFWVDEMRGVSYRVYRELIAQLDVFWGRTVAADEPEAPFVVLDPTGASRELIPIDFWFVEAYWKIASLHLDLGQYAEAAYEISRTLVGSPMGPAPLLEQAYEFLAKAYFHLDDPDRADHFAQKTLQLNPRNAAVREYLRR